jgi:5-methyltetrahydropteroyltriglutamate--homocysteine methyltransferase
MIRTTVVGSYPRVSDAPLEVSLRQSIHRHDRREMDDAQLEAAYQATIKRVLDEQAQAGIDLVTDGQVRWDDLLTPFVRAMEGAHTGGLLRYYDNNVYYRHPVVTGALRRQRPAVVEDFRYAQSVSARPVKAVLVGPFTLATLSEDRFYGDLSQLALAAAEVLHQEAQDLVKAGATVVQIDEPALGYHAHKVHLARAALERVVHGLGVKTVLATYFGPLEAVYPALLDFPVDQLALDIAERPHHLSLVLANPGTKELTLGVVNARNTRLEREADLLGMLQRVTERVPADRLWIGPSTGLEFLPHATARRKLDVLVAAARRFNGSRAPVAS